MPKALDPHGPSVQLAPIRVPATLAARLEAFVLRPSLFPPSLAAVTRAAIEAGIAVLEGASAPAAPALTSATTHAPTRAPRKRRPSDEKRAAERAAARAAREAQSRTEAEG